MSDVLGCLFFSNGESFDGKFISAPGTATGETVFNTGMVGYPETLTDPSYHGQILVLTYPLIGNYGIKQNPEKKYLPDSLSTPFESSRIQIAGLIIQEYSSHYSHWSAKQSLARWLNAYKIPALTGIDTRAVTMLLRKSGTMLGRIEIQGSSRSHSALTFSADPNARNLVAEVSCTRTIRYLPKRQQTHSKKLLLIDCGVKLSIIRALLKRGRQVIRVPWNYKLAASSLSFDGIIISNGPGNPKMCNATIDSTRYALARRIPILGICLGNQLLALAAGADTYKLKYGHRSQNQPCIERKSGRCIITTQNHGYGVKRETLPSGWNIWFSNANDNTIEGIRHSKMPWMAVQFHPEANPGPTDADWIFDEFLKRL